MKESEMEKLCPVCGKKIIGRVDKKFCNEQCKSDFHNKEYRDKRARINKFKKRFFLNLKLTHCLEFIIEKISNFGN